MSYDELPPDAQPPHSAEQATSSEQDPSVQDAPPAAPTRRRRAKAAGTDAASTTEPAQPVTVQPARTTRRRVAAGPVADTASAPVAEIPSSIESEPSVSAAEPSDPVAPQAKSNRRRKPSSRTAKTGEAEAEPTPPPTKQRAHAPPVQEGEVETETASPPPPPVVAVEATPNASRRTRRSRKVLEPTSAAPEGAETSAQSPSMVSQEPLIELPLVAEEVSPVAADMADTQEARPTKRRNRRSRKSTTTTPTPSEPPASQQEEETTEAGIGETPTAEAVAIPQTSEEGRETRSRRNRRGGRSRPTETRTEPAEEVAQEVVVEPPIPVYVEPVIDLSVGTHLVVHNGTPVIHINGAPYPPMIFFGNTEESKNREPVRSEIRHAATAGVHLHSTLIDLPCPLSEASHALDEVDTRLRVLLDADPAGFVMPRIVFSPARGWKREYPNEISAYADGTNGDTSLTGVRFWQECERSLETLIAHINDQRWGARIFGYHLERGEWFQPAEMGFDRSMANRDAFRDWLREKYRHDLVSLRAAWYDGDVQFHTAEIPTLISKPNPQHAFYETRRERSLIDFNEFTSESTALRLISLARVVKKVTSSNALVSLCYGYTLEFGHGFSGHLALDLLLADRSIDLICGPPSYRDRKAGGAASYPGPTASPALHGKLWLSEDDTKTWLAPLQQDPQDFNPRINDRFQTEQAQIRALGKALIHGTAIGWMDLWGEGWLNDEGMWNRIGVYTNYLRTRIEAQDSLPASSDLKSQILRLKNQVSTGPEVVALIDEKSLLHIQKGEAFFRRLTNGLRDTLQRAGVSYGIYLQSDLTTPDFPTDAKLYLFLTPYRLTTAQRTAIKEKLQRDNKTLAWLYAPGACEESPGLGSLMDETASGVVGITLRRQPWNSEVGSHIIDTSHPLTERLGARDLGARERLNPSFYVDDPEATILAEYHGSSLPSLAVRSHSSWRSVFVGDAVLPLELLRGICKYAGVHIWVGGGEDVLEAGSGWVMLHASRDGQRTLRLPVKTGLYDVTEQRLVADEVREHRFFLRTGNTRLFFVGTIEQMSATGLPSVETVGRARIVLPDAPESAPSPSVVPSLPDRLPAEIPSSDLETLRAVLAMEIPESGLEVEVDADESTEVTTPRTRLANIALLDEALGLGETGNGRRKRRRGGRGRGRRKPNATDPEATDTSASPPGERERSTRRRPNKNEG